MMELLLFTGVMIQVLTITCVIDMILGIKNKHQMILGKIICISVSMIARVFADGLHSWGYICYIALNLFMFCIYIMYFKRQEYRKMLAIVFFASVIDICSAVFASFPAYYIVSNINITSNQTLQGMISYLIKIIVVVVIYEINRRSRIDGMFQRGTIQIAMIGLGMLFQGARSVLYLYRYESQNVFNNIALTILLMGISMGTLWMIDWHLGEKERERLWQDNQRMSSQIHRSKEIIPALNNTIGKLKLKENEDVDEILSEIHQLCQEQMEENESELMKEKQFPSTGMVVLDEQIESFGKQAGELGIHFEVFAAESVKDAIKKLQIKELDFLRLVGDLLRNAFRAVKRKGTNSILLAFGYQEGVFQVEVYDDGVCFPIEVLNAFGIRGVTTEGTGNGIADILACLERYQASYCIEEYDGDDIFTKGICIMWDGKNRRMIRTFRYQEIESTSILHAIGT